MGHTRPGCSQPVEIKQPLAPSSERSTRSAPANTKMLTLPNVKKRSHSIDMVLPCPGVESDPGNLGISNGADITKGHIPHGEHSKNGLLPKRPLGFLTFKDVRQEGSTTVSATSRSIFSVPRAKAPSDILVEAAEKTRPASSEPRKSDHRTR